MAHFKPFTRAKSGPHSFRDSSRYSYYSDDSSYRYRRGRNVGLIVLDLGL